MSKRHRSVPPKNLWVIDEAMTQRLRRRVMGGRKSDDPEKSEPTTTHHTVTVSTGSGAHPDVTVDNSLK